MLNIFSPKQSIPPLFCIIVSTTEVLEFIDYSHLDHPVAVSIHTYIAV